MCECVWLGVVNKSVSVPVASVASITPMAIDNRANHIEETNSPHLVTNTLSHIHRIARATLIANENLPSRSLAHIFYITNKLYSLKFIGYVMLCSYIIQNQENMLFNNGACGV